MESRRWKKRERGVSSTVAALIDNYPEDCVIEAAKKLRSSGVPLRAKDEDSSRASIAFHDPSTADVVLRLVNEEDHSTASLIHHHTPALRRSAYFSALLSPRWSPKSTLELPVSPHRSLDNYLAVLRLLYTPPHAPFPVPSASAALDLLPPALHILFEDLVRFCVRTLEALPWTDDEEARVLQIIPLLNASEADYLLARLSPSSDSPAEEMLHGLISQAIHNFPNSAYAKHFVSILLRDLPSKNLSKTALDRAFSESLTVVKDSLDEYSSPDFRGDQNETEAKQRAHLQNLFSNLRHLCWLLERMIELKVPDRAVELWSSQTKFTSELQWVFRDDTWRDIVPGLATILLRCTTKIATAVATGAILATRQVRAELVKNWLPVMTLWRENASTTFPAHRSVFVELEETFLKIISTLPLADAQVILQQCLGFSTRSVDDCGHLKNAFHTWFRRAGRNASAAGD